MMKLPKLPPLLPVDLKKIMLVVMLGLFSIVFAGCGNQEAQQKNITAAAESVSVTIPKEKPALTGKVKQIIGNEVTVYKAEDTQVKEDSTEETAKQPQNQAQDAAASTAGPQNASKEMTFTEETETFLIPVGAPIISMQNGSAKEIELTKISSEDILKIWKQDDTITCVQVSGNNKAKSSEKGQTNGQGNGQGDPMGGPPPGV